MSTLEQLPMWVVTDHPRDYPGHYVARKNIWDEASKAYVPTGEALLAEKLGELNETLRAMGFTWLPRFEHDDSKILGTWF